MVKTRGNLWLMERAAEAGRPLVNPSARFVWNKSLVQPTLFMFRRESPINGILAKIVV